MQILVRVVYCIENLQRLSSAQGKNSVMDVKCPAPLQVNQSPKPNGVGCSDVHFEFGVAVCSRCSDVHFEFEVAVCSHIHTQGIIWWFQFVTGLLWKSWRLFWTFLLEFLSLTGSQEAVGAVDFEVKTLGVS